MLRGDLQVNEVKLANALAADDGPPQLSAMTDLEASSAGIVVGYASPVGLASGVRVIADSSVPESPNLVAGANREGYHLRNVNHGREWQAEIVADIALAEPGHLCARCAADTAPSTIITPTRLTTPISPRRRRERCSLVTRISRSGCSGSSVRRHGSPVWRAPSSSR